MENNKTLYSVLGAVQKELNAPKTQHNKFGNYNYRSAEDICEAVKPLLAKYGATIFLSDKIEAIGERVYVVATATFVFGNESISVSAGAREEREKKGMDAAQITGSASSYARKYALNGLLLIDDCKDPDTRDNREAPEPTFTQEQASKAMERYGEAVISACEEMGYSSPTQIPLSRKNEFFAICKKFSEPKGE